MSWCAVTRSRRFRRNPSRLDRRADTRIIEGGGRTLMPGLIDNHWHAMLMRPTPAQAFGDVGYNNLAGWRRGDRHSDARLHHRSRRGRAGVRSQERHRRGHRQGPAHLSVRRHDHCHERAWGFPPAHRSAADDRRHAHPHGADRRRHGRGQPRRGARARPRTAHAGRLPGQVDGGRRGVVTLQSDRRDHLHRGRTARRG